MALNTTAAQMVARARASIEEIETADAIALLQDPDVVFVDLRDVRERERMGYIPGSFHCPRGMLEFWVDPDSPYFKPIFGEAKRFVFHCASGWRSALSVALLNDMGFACAHLKEGFSTWEQQGGPVVRPEDRRQTDGKGPTA
jgi:rhodanese-related sulfurtransferase